MRFLELGELSLQKAGEKFVGRFATAGAFQLREAALPALQVDRAREIANMVLIRLRSHDPRIPDLAFEVIPGTSGYLPQTALFTLCADGDFIATCPTQELLAPETWALSEGSVLIVAGPCLKRSYGVRVRPSMRLAIQRGDDPPIFHVCFASLPS